MLGIHVRPTLFDHLYLRSHSQKQALIYLSDAPKIPVQHVPYMDEKLNDWCSILSKLKVKYVIIQQTYTELRSMDKHVQKTLKSLLTDKLNKKFKK